MRVVLRRVPRPLDVSVLIHRVHDPAAYDKATLEEPRRHAPPHHTARPWRRPDVLVGPGLAESRERPAAGPTILVPRRIFEGKPENGFAFAPMLDRFASREGVARSRLSGEGGDLQFARDPRDPSRLVLFYGSFAKPYWAETLSSGEFEYVLCVEFGADRAVDLGGVAPHVDYFVSLLPRAGMALVGVPVSGDLAVARAALDALLARIAGPKPEVLVELRDQLSSPSPDLDRARQGLSRAPSRTGGSSGASPSTPRSPSACARWWRACAPAARTACGPRTRCA